MKKLLMFVLSFGLAISIIIYGHYTNSDSVGYCEENFGGLCQSCNRTFLFSADTFKNYENVQCPYCGVVQNTVMANNRYAYDKQQRDTQNMGNFLKGMQQSQMEHYKKRQEIDQRFSQEVLNHFNPKSKERRERGTATNPIHIEIED